MIRMATDEDIKDIATVHGKAFVRQHSSLLFIKCMFSAYPLFRIFVFDDTRIKGYAIWAEKSGFREQAVIELVQVGILPEYQNNGLGSQLLLKSYELTEQQIQERGGTIGSILITTADDNPAIALYKRLFGVELRGAIPNLFRHPEIILVAKMT